MKILAIALNDGNSQQRNNITKYFAENNFIYWHWIDDFWMVEVPDIYSPKSFHEIIERIPQVGTPSVLVFEVKNNFQYWGRNKDDSWNWFKNIGSAG